MTKRESLHEQKASLELELKALNSEIGFLVNKRSGVKFNLDKVIKELEAFDKEVIVTDHAVLRYLERVENVDVDLIKKKLLPPSLENQIKVLGSGEFAVDGFKVRVRRGVVVTVINGEKNG